MSKFATNHILDRHLLSSTGRLLQNKLNELQSLCRGCGISPSGTKAELTTRLIEHAIPLPDNPWYLVSLDIGINNFAKAILNISSTRQLSLIEWQKLSLDISHCSHPRETAMRLRDFCETMTKTFGMDSVVYLIERQSFRGGGVRMIPGIVQKINMIETQLHCFLLDNNVQSIDPRIVATFFNFRTGRKKKTDAVRFIDEVLLSEPSIFALSMSSSISNYYREQSKKDDLADALLQGLAYYQWRLNMAKLHEMLLPEFGKTT